MKKEKGQNINSEKIEKIKNLFAGVEEEKRELAYDAIEEYVFFAEKLAELKKLPLIRIHQKNPARQIATPAAKLIKEYSQVIDAKRKTLLMILYRVEASEQNELLEALKSFEL